MRLYTKIDWRRTPYRRRSPYGGVWLATRSVPLAAREIHRLPVVLGSLAERWLARKIVNAMLKASFSNSSRLRLGCDFRMVKANLRPNQNL
jgi:hypothetical protein